MLNKYDYFIKALGNNTISELSKETCTNNLHIFFYEMNISCILLNEQNNDLKNIIFGIFFFVMGFYHVLVTVVLVDSSKQCLLRGTLKVADNTTLQEAYNKIQITS